MAVPKNNTHKDYVPYAEHCMPNEVPNSRGKMLYAVRAIDGAAAGLAKAVSRQLGRLWVFGRCPQPMEHIAD
jgi:hypothetical protein